VVLTVALTTTTTKVVQMTCRGWKKQIKASLWKNDACRRRDRKFLPCIAQGE
jgi:hypothetical protein